MNYKNEDKLQNFFSRYPLKNYNKGEVILNPNEKPTFVGFQKSGYIKAFVKDTSRHKFSTAFFRSILPFTSIYALYGITNRLTFKAATKVELRTAPITDFLSFCTINPDVEKQINKIISVSFLDYIYISSSLLTGNSLEKVAIIVDFLNENKIRMATTHELIAEMTGLTRETVTLQIIKLKDLKIINNIHRKIKILNQQELNKIINNDSEFIRYKGG